MFEVICSMNTIYKQLYENSHALTANALDNVRVFYQTLFSDQEVPCIYHVLQ
jgi:hypothetical protein